MYVSEDALIKRLEIIKNKLQENNLLSGADEFCIAVLTTHLEQLRDKSE